MTSRISPLVAVFISIPSLDLGAQTVAPDPASDEIRRLITCLGADQFSERKKAQDKLLEMGSRAVPTLEAFRLATDDPEIRNQIVFVLKWSDWGLDREGFEKFGPILEEYDDLPPPERAERIARLPGLDPDRALPCLFRILRKDDHDLARASAVRAISAIPPDRLDVLDGSDPEQLAAQSGLAWAYSLRLYRSGRNAEAAKYLGSFANRRPEDVETCFALSDVLSELKCIDDSSRILTQAVGNRPRDRELRLRVADFLLRADRPAQAVLHYLEAMRPFEKGREEPLKTEALKTAIEVMIYNRQATSPRTSTESVLASVDPSYWPAYAKELRNGQRYPDAVTAYRAALGMDPDNGEIHYGYTLSLIGAGRPLEAERDVLEIITSRRPDDSGDFRYSSFDLIEKYLDAFAAITDDGRKADAYRNILAAIVPNSDLNLTGLLVAHGATHGWPQEAQALVARTDAEHLRELSADPPLRAIFQGDPWFDALRRAAVGDLSGALQKLAESTGMTQSPDLSLQRILLAAESGREDAAVDATERFLADPGVSAVHAEIAAEALDRFGFPRLRDCLVGCFQDDPRIILLNARLAMARGDLDAAENAWRRLLGGPEENTAAEWLSASDVFRGRRPPPIHRVDALPPQSDLAAFLRSSRTTDLERVDALETIINLHGAGRMTESLRDLERFDALRQSNLLHSLIYRFRSRPDAPEALAALVEASPEAFQRIDAETRGIALTRAGRFADAVGAFTGSCGRGIDSTQPEAFESFWAVGDFPRALASGCIQHISSHGWPEWTLIRGEDIAHRHFRTLLPTGPDTARQALSARGRMPPGMFTDRLFEAAELLEAAGEMAGARVLFHALTLDSQKGWAAVPEYVRLLERDGRDREAVSFLTKVCRLDERPLAASWMVIASARAERGDGAGAAEAEQACRMAGTSSKYASVRSGQWLIAHGYPRQAEKEFEKALRSAFHGNEWEYSEENACEYLAYLRAEEGRHAEAQRLLHRAIDMLKRNKLRIYEPGGDDRARTLILAVWPARKRLHEGNYEEAKQLLEAALRLDPEFDETWDLLLPLTEKAERNSLAIRRRELLIRAARRYPLDPVAATKLGDFCLREGLDPAPARESVARILRTAPFLTPKLNDLPQRLGM